MPLDILLERQKVLADLLETCNRELEELCPEYEKPIKKIDFENGNGYFEIYYVHNEENFNHFMDGLKEYIQATRDIYTDCSDVSMGKTEKEETEYAIQDILSVIHGVITKG